MKQQKLTVWLGGLCSQSNLLGSARLTSTRFVSLDSSLGNASISSFSMDDGIWVEEDEEQQVIRWEKHRQGEKWFRPHLGYSEYGWEVFWTAWHKVLSTAGIYLDWKKVKQNGALFSSNNSCSFFCDVNFELTLQQSQSEKQFILALGAWICQHTRHYFIYPAQNKIEVTAFWMTSRKHPISQASGKHCVASSCVMQLMNPMHGQLLVVTTGDCKASWELRTIPHNLFTWLFRGPLCV